MTLDKVIQEIIDIDLACSSRVEEAKKKKIDVQTNMNTRKKEIYDTFVQEYQAKADRHKKALEKQIQETKEKNEKEYKESLEKLSQLYDQNKEQWIKDIVARCKEI